jgi:Protein of unknown function (DUF2911)
MFYPPTMKQTIAVAILSFLLAPVVQAQEKKSPVVALSEPALGERGTSRVLYWNQEKDVAVAAVTVDFGRPVWKKEYDEAIRFDLATKGKVWRLGNDYWTILDSNVPMKIAGRDIPIGLWYLGLDRSNDGSSWSLAFIDPVKVRRSRLDAFAMDTVPVDFKVPMTTEQPAGLTEKLTLTLSASKEDIKSVTLRISWGRLQLMAPVQVLLQN